MSFGHCNARATFERLMNLVLGRLKWSAFLCYLDGIVVFAPSFGEPVSRLTEVLTCLQNANSVVKHKKCRFGESKLKELGHVVGFYFTNFDPAKLHSNMHFPISRNTRALKIFLGLVSCYRCFISGFSHIRPPLNFLLRKYIPFLCELSISSVLLKPSEKRWWRQLCSHILIVPFLLSLCRCQRLYHWNRPRTTR